jgi:hypothetical protein
MNGDYPYGVLGSDGSQGRSAVDTQGGKSLQVGLNASAAP